MLKANTIYAGEFGTSVSPVSAPSSPGESKSGSEVSGGGSGGGDGDGGDEREEGSSHKVVQWFWEIMENKFNNQERSKFLMFAWGRTRLPLNKKDFTTKMEIIVRCLFVSVAAAVVVVVVVNAVLMLC